MDNKTTIKKFIAALLTLICSAAAVFLLTNLNLIIFTLTLFNLPMTILIGLSLAVALGFASSRVAKLLKRRIGLRVRWFALSAYAPSFIGAVVYWLAYLKLSDLHYFTGYFAGLSEFIFGLSLAPTAAVYMMSGLFFCTVGKHNKQLKGI